MFPVLAKVKFIGQRQVDVISLVNKLNKIGNV